MEDATGGKPLDRQRYPATEGSVGAPWKGGGERTPTRKSVSYLPPAGQALTPELLAKQRAAARWEWGEMSIAKVAAGLNGNPDAAKVYQQRADEIEADLRALDERSRRGPAPSAARGAQPRSERQRYAQRLRDQRLPEQQVRQMTARRFGPQ